MEERTTSKKAQAFLEYVLVFVCVMLAVIVLGNFLNKIRGDSAHPERGGFEKTFRDEIVRML